MSRKIITAVFLCVFFASASLYAQANNNYTFAETNQKGDTLFYNIVNGNSTEVGVARSSYKPIITDTLYVPDKVEHAGRTYTVTLYNGEMPISTGPYRDKFSTFSHVVLPETIRLIGTIAFYRNDSLLEAVIPSSCTSLGMRAFAYCPRLKWVDCSKAQFDTCWFEFIHSKNLQWIVPPKTLEVTSGAFDFSDLPNLRFVLFPENVKCLKWDVLATVYPSSSEAGDSSVPFIFLSQTPPRANGGHYPTLKKFNAVAYYPCGADTAYQRSWLNKHTLRPGLFLENGYMFIDSICPSTCKQIYGFRPDSIGVWIVKKYNQQCGCDSVNVYIVRSMLPDATLNDSSINVEPDRKDTTVTWTWEGTGVEYNVYREGQLVATVKEPFYHDTDIIPGVQYCYNFAPVNAFGCEGVWSTTNCYTMVFDDGIRDAAAAAGLRLRPNPARERIFIENLPESLSDAEVVLYDPTGRELLRQNGTADGIDISALARGVYFLRIGGMHGKFVKE